MKGWVSHAPVYCAISHEQHYIVCDTEPFLAKQSNSCFLPRLLESGEKICCLESSEELRFRRNKNELPFIMSVGIYGI